MDLCMIHIHHFLAWVMCLAKHKAISLRKMMCEYACCFDHEWLLAGEVFFPPPRRIV